jgi:AcrR family transcriptional regulator
VVAERNAEQTRERILMATFDLMFKNGYQGMRVDQILATTGLAKGALYHHFSNKQSLGYAVVDELLQGRIQEFWINPLAECDNPIETINTILQGHVNEMQCHPEQMALGCPLNNISQEMAGLDEGFKERLEKIYDTWTGAISDALTKGQQKGQVKQDLEPDVAAIFMISSMQGIIGAAKCMQNADMFGKLIGALCDYVSGLRAVN